MPLPLKKHSRDVPPKKDFDVIMSETTSSMPRHTQLFSSFIHQKHIALLSRIANTIIARPNALLVGAILSFACTLCAYLLSKNLGYTLSGFESIGAFIVGWTLGNLYDIFSLLTRKK